MLKKGLNSTMHWLLHKRMQRVSYFLEHAEVVQTALMHQCVQSSKLTEFGRLHQLEGIKNYKDFAEKIPLQDYDTLKPFIRRMMLGEPNILVGGKVKWFAKSSGTTEDKSKFIPVTMRNLKTCHLKGGWDTAALMYDARPQGTNFEGKMLLIGGAYAPFSENPYVFTGDVSSIMLGNLPSVANFIYAPHKSIALHNNFEEKIELMAQSLIKEDMRTIGGVPSWTLLLLRRVLEITKKEHILEVWPHLQSYIHGGVSFVPYKKVFEQLIPDKNFQFWEIYNASEGYFATQHSPAENDMALLLQNGVFFEFLPESEWHSAQPIAIQLSDVEIGKKYAPVITTNAGLWRYIPGDTVEFTCTSPFKIRICGRINQFVNAFGEEVMVANTDKALASACDVFGAQVRDYTVAPIFFDGAQRGGHEWLIEFENPPNDLEAFNTHLDTTLQSLNSDYEAKRFKNLAMQRPSVRQLPKGTFYKWLKAKGKLGSQNKVPRLANHRQYVEEILTFV